MTLEVGDVGSTSLVSIHAAGGGTGLSVGSPDVASPSAGSPEVANPSPRDDSAPVLVDGDSSPEGENGNSPEGDNGFCADFRLPGELARNVAQRSRQFDHVTPERSEDGAAFV